MIAPSSEEKPLYSHVVSAVSFPYHILYSLVLLLSPTLFAYKLSSLFILPFLLLIPHYLQLTFTLYVIIPFSINNPDHNDVKRMSA